MEAVAVAYAIVALFLSISCHPISGESDWIWGTLRINHTTIKVYPLIFGTAPGRDRGSPHLSVTHKF